MAIKNKMEMILKLVLLLAVSIHPIMIPPFLRNESDMAEEDVRDTVRLQKLFRKLQRQVHSPEHQVVIQVAEHGLRSPMVQ